jgi:FMN-dependent NADH-azoreductase
MTQILLVISSPRGAASYSTQVARVLTDKLAAAASPSNVTVRDLTREPRLPHIDEHFATGRLLAPTDARTPDQKAALAISDELLKELFAADVIVIASSMINFSISSTLKTYVDYVTRPGVTFRYTEKGPEGLLKGKKVYLVQARGGVYSQGGPAAALNFQEPYLRTILGFSGLTDVVSIVVEGVAYGPEVTDKAVAAALAQVDSLVA